jgi:hypothetical protein
LSKRNLHLFFFLLSKGVAKTEGLREGQSPLGLTNLKTKFFPVRLFGISTGMYLQLQV